MSIQIIPTLAELVGRPGQTYEAMVPSLFTQEEFVFNHRLYLDKNGKVLYGQKYVETGPFSPKAQQPFALQWSLNPGQAAEKALIDTKGEGLTVKENILGVIFTDGTSVKLLESLPEINK